MNLAEEIRRAQVPQGSLMICWLGQAGYLLKDSCGRTLVIDPYLTNCGERIRGFKRLSPMLLAPEELAPDYYVITHTHFDHLDYDAIPVVKERSPKTQFFGPTSCLNELAEMGVDQHRCHRLDRGMRFEDRHVLLEATYADHGTMAPDAIGVLLEMGGRRLYFSGDTAFHEDLFCGVANFRPEIVFLSVNGKFGNMNGEEGARAAERTGARYAVPCHCWTFAEHGGDPGVFCDGLRDRDCIPICFRQGEARTLDCEKLFQQMEESA